MSAESQSTQRLQVTFGTTHRTGVREREAGTSCRWERQISSGPVAAAETPEQRDRSVDGKFLKGMPGGGGFLLNWPNRILAAEGQRLGGLGTDDFAESWLRPGPPGRASQGQGRGLLEKRLPGP